MNATKPKTVNLPVPARPRRRKKFDFAEGAILLITWIDASDKPGWHNVEEVVGTLTTNLQSVGFYVRQNQRYLFLASDVDLDDKDTVRNPGAIPKAWVKEAVVLVRKP